MVSELRQPDTALIFGTVPKQMSDTPLQFFSDQMKDAKYVRVLVNQTMEVDKSKLEPYTPRLKPP